MASIGVTEARIKPDFDLVYALFVLFLLVEIYLLLDPFYAGIGKFRMTRDLGPLKYAALAVALGAAALGLLGFRLSRVKLPPAAYGALTRGWPILLLCAYIVCGSAYARFALSLEHAFLPAGLSLLGYPLAVLLYFSVGNRSRLVSTFFWGLLLATPYEAGWIALKRVEGGQAFHNEIFLIVPLAVYFFHASRSLQFAWTVAIYLVLTGLATNKYTGYATLLITLFFLCLPRVTRYLTHRDITKRLVFSYFAFVMLLGFSLVAAYLFLHRHLYLPTGDLPVRYQTYLSAWQAFLSSPLYGDGFAGTTLQSLTGITVLGHSHIPTHSDFLDILSHGGLVGAGLYVYGLANIIWPSTLRDIATTSPHKTAHINGLVTIVVCGIFAMLFNPILISIQVSLLFWMALGFLASVTSASDNTATLLPAARERG